MMGDFHYKRVFSAFARVVSARAPQNPARSPYYTFHFRANSADHSLRNRHVPLMGFYDVLWRVVVAYRHT